MPGLSPHMKIKKGRPLVNWPGGNTPPNISIDSFDATPDLADNPFTSEFTASADDAQQGDISANIVWRIVSALAVPASAGEQTVDLGSGKVGGSATGLANDATVFTATVRVDAQEVPQNISIVGSAAQTITTLLAELDADTTGATWALTGGNLVCTSDSTGVSSAIALVDTDLFSSVTDFSSILAAVAGADIIPEVTAQGGSGGTPSLTFTLVAVQNIYADITDGFGATATASQAIEVTNVV